MAMVPRQQVIAVFKGHPHKAKRLNIDRRRRLFLFAEDARRRTRLGKVRFLDRRLSLT